MIKLISKLPNHTPEQKKNPVFSNTKFTLSSSNQNYQECKAGKYGT